MKYKTQDSKFWIENNRLVGQSGPVPADEPLFIIRGRDLNAVETLEVYSTIAEENGADKEHIKAVEKRIEQFAEFRAENPDRMKTPDTDAALLHDRQIE